MTTVEELNKLTREIIENPTKINEFDEELMLKLRKHMNPLGNVIKADKTYANLSVINYRDKYLRRLHMTALVGMLYRSVGDYEVPQIDEANQKLRVEMEALANDPNIDPKLLTQAQAELKAIHKARVKALKDTSTGIIRDWLNRNFKYNPDLHVRGSHSENKDDPDRGDIGEIIREHCAVASGAAAVEAKLESKPDMTFAYMKSMLAHTYQNAVALRAQAESLLRTDISEETQSLIMKNYMQLCNIEHDMKKIVDPVAAAETLSCYKIDPPADAFYHFERYINNNYEQLNDVVTALYNEKKDFEYAVVFYDAFKSEEEAKNYRNQHEKEFRSDVFTVENNCVTLIGPFNQNRARVDYYNKNTEVLKRMTDQVEADHKIGKELMEKQIKIKKTKNILEEGPDHPALAQYSKTMNQVSALGAKKGLTKEEQEELVASKQRLDNIAEDYAVPDDGIQVDMFFAEPNADGEQTFNRTKFYTAAVAPEVPDEQGPKA